MYVQLCMCTAERPRKSIHTYSLGLEVRGYHHKNIKRYGTRAESLKSLKFEIFTFLRLIYSKTTRSFAPKLWE